MNWLEKIIQKMDSFFAMSNPECPKCDSKNTKFLWEDNFLEAPKDLYQCKDCKEHFYG